MLHIQLYTGSIDEAFKSFYSPYINAKMGLNWAYLIQQSAPEEAGLVLFKVYQDQDLVGLAILLELRNLKAYRYLWRPIVKIIENAAFLQRLFPSLRVGFLEVPIANYSGLLTVPTVNAVQRAEVIKQISTYCQTQLKWHFLCVKQDTPNSGEDLLDKSFNSLDFLPNTILALSYRSFTDFIASLPSKKRRKLLADQKLLTKFKARIEICEQPACISEELYTLYQKTNHSKQQQSNYIPTPIPIKQVFFTNLADFPQLQPKAITIRNEQGLIAYCLLIQSDTTLYFKSVGLDYDLSTSTHAYFNLVYSTIEFAIQQGCQQIDFGMTSYTFKKRMGCVLHPTHYQVAFYHPVLHSLRKVFLYLLARQFDAVDD